MFIAFKDDVLLKNLVANFIMALKFDTSQDVRLTRINLWYLRLLVHIYYFTCEDIAKALLLLLLRLCNIRLHWECVLSKLWAKIQHQDQWDRRSIMHNIMSSGWAIVVNARGTDTSISVLQQMYKDHFLPKRQRWSTRLQAEDFILTAEHTEW